ncbi:hypothetical protein [Gallibacterium sp. AGMB14963]|uniref:hypothetical protein n=1 Tax=Gallibacterium faecale TaxID=3019086 RepID=UPI0022F176A3|nr:hypothetical protein [Gallibacterium sp. AGMB14963]MDA3979461.1 hypothetical protein [Gallibacterium sp. AGMB14963]
MLTNPHSLHLSDSTIQQLYKLAIAKNLFRAADFASEIRRLTAVLNSYNRFEQADQLVELALAIDPMLERDIPLNQKIRNARSARLANNPYYQRKNDYSDDDEPF